MCSQEYVQKNFCNEDGRIALYTPRHLAGRRGFWLKRVDTFLGKWRYLIVGHRTKMSGGNKIVGERLWKRVSVM